MEHMASGRERRLLPEFLLACLSTDAFFEHMSRHAKGSKMPGGDRDATMRYHVPVPDIDTQRYAVATICEMEETTKQLIEKLEAERETVTMRTRWWHEERVGISHANEAEDGIGK
jgi:hypothetical protein